MVCKEKIIEKISKLRNLHLNNSNPDEASNAEVLIQDLLFKHNLTEDDLKTELEKTPIYEKEYYNLGVASPASKFWKAALMNIIAENNFCKLFNTNGKEIIIIGQENNRSVVKYLYEYLVNDLSRMQKVAFKTTKDYINNPVLWKKSFYIGAVSTIQNRLKAQKQQNIAEANLDNNKGTMLALKIDNALRDAVQDLIGAVRQGRAKKTKVDGNGYASGVQAGNSAQLNKSIPQNRIALSC